jgi:hypothetical protein
MSARTPRDAVLSNIIAVSTISFLTGIFLMQGVVNAVRGEQLLMWLFFLCIPIFAASIVIVTRRTLRLVG